MESKRDVSLTLNMTRFHVSLRASVTSVAINEQRIPIFVILKLLAAEEIQNTRARRNVSFCPATSGGVPLSAPIHDSIRAAEIIPPTSLQGESSPHSISLPLLLHFAPLYDRIAEACGLHDYLRLCENGNCRTCCCYGTKSKTSLMRKKLRFYRFIACKSKAFGQSLCRRK